MIFTALTKISLSSSSFVSNQTNYSFGSNNTIQEQSMNKTSGNSVFGSAKSYRRI
ncbi:hypothetical protein DFA_10194 [Cavenderia fasciculata]|uniref:Uncharacterized protein n=1 Tax=Cavenderia fasciculata TaxID=261658 RepID=F4Q9J1_CACFS|nr:uncharacterized protein DFA_10194 [Cavenderia fasciculata]EGG15360.1 hypothetical protein DFA_10194 [Cavenderia fasciculata]|eukprot:XP_004354102.1 hypothetical protein DFA_10194 [Cavenderia fasciculata]